jgi:hypothetical protein
MHEVLIFLPSTVWLHFPKCGTSFGVTLVHCACPQSAHKLLMENVSSKRFVAPLMSVYIAPELCHSSFMKYDSALPCVQSTSYRIADSEKQTFHEKDQNCHQTVSQKIRNPPPTPQIFKKYLCIFSWKKGKIVSKK